MTEVTGGNMDLHTHTYIYMKRQKKNITKLQFFRRGSSVCHMGERVSLIAGVGFRSFSAVK